MLRQILLTKVQASARLTRFSKSLEPFSTTVRWKHTESDKTYQGIFAPFLSGGHEDAEEDKARQYYRRLTAYDTAKSASPPTRTRMLVRDFIDDSLYNPNYGYFSKQAVIFSPETDFDFNGMRDHLEFMNILGQLYKDMESEADDVDDVARQVWHTPTELFKVIKEEKRPFVYIFVIAMVWLRCCKILGIRIQTKLIPQQRFDYLRNGCW